MVEPEDFLKHLLLDTGDTDVRARATQSAPQQWNMEQARGSFPKCHCSTLEQSSATEGSGLKAGSGCLSTAEGLQGYTSHPRRGAASSGGTAQTLPFLAFGFSILMESMKISWKETLRVHSPGKLLHFEAEVCVSSHFCAVLQHFIYTCLGSLCFFPEKFPVHPVPCKARERQAGTGRA